MNHMAVRTMTNDGIPIFSDCFLNPKEITHVLTHTDSLKKCIMKVAKSSIQKLRDAN